MDINNVRLLKQIIRKSPNYIFWKDTNLIYQGCNDNFARAAGFESPQQVIGKTDDQMKWGKYTGHIYQAEDREIIETGKPILNKEVPMVMEQDQQQYLSVSKVPLYDSKGMVTGILGIYIDITRQKEMEKTLILAKEKAEAGSKAKTEFLYNVRHDIRTPFSGLLGLATILEAEEKNPQKKEYLHDIAQSAQELLNYFNEIVEYMELEDSTIPILYKPFNIRKVFDEIATMLQC